MSSPLILLDMDGVICNWVKGCCLAHNRHDLAERADAGEYPSNWDMDGELGDDADIWWPVDIAGEQFWIDLEPYKWMTKLIETIDYTGLPWFICTHARRTPESHYGKVAWLQQYLGEEFDRIIMTKHKHFMAGPNRLLIDDNEDNCKKFTEAGGRSYLFPQAWNSNSGFSRLVGLRMVLEETYGKEIFNVRI